MKDNRTAEQIQADTLRVLNRDAELRAEKTPAPPREAQQALPKRDVKALVEALRIRALALTGQEWERTATRDMMKEAAQMLEDMEAALHASEAGPRDAFKGETAVEALAWDRGWRFCKAQIQAEAGPQAPREEPRPIALSSEQQEAATLWAADDRLWTTQEVVEFNLKVFARKILGLEAGVSARVPEEPHA